MSVLAVMVVTPVAIWAIDWFLCRGEFAGLVLEFVHERRAQRHREARRQRLGAKRA